LFNNGLLNNVMTLKPYHQLDCPDDLQKTISEKAIDFLKTKYEFHFKNNTFYLIKKFCLFCNRR